jgi:tetratricopeptide (TPR) repeat protein
MSTYNEELEAARLVTRAKRDKEAAKDLRDEGDIVGAIEVLAGAVKAYDESLLVAGLEATSSASKPTCVVATQLADLLGMLGGNHRRLGQREQAQACFDRGSRLEASPVLGVMSSYNLVNAITLPIESDPQALVARSEALARAVAAIERQVAGERRNDRWAWADLAQCQLLLDRVDDALRSYARVRSLGDDDTFTSVIGVLERLRDAVPALEARVAAAVKVLRPGDGAHR